MDLKGQMFGIEIEMTGITRQRAAEVAAEYFGTSSRYTGSFYGIYTALDGQDASGNLCGMAVLIHSAGKEGRKSQPAKNIKQRW